MNVAGSGNVLVAVPPTRKRTKNVQLVKAWRELTNKMNLFL